MALPYLQPWQDWVTQAWNILLGRRVAAPSDDWLVGPFGEPGVHGEGIVAGLAAREGLTIDRERTPRGLVDSFAAFPGLAGAIRPEIVAFYTATSEYDFDVWSKWEPGWGFFGRLVRRLFSQRIGQLDLPGDPLATAAGVTSEVIVLRDAAGVGRHRVWLRKLRGTGGVIYAGVYAHGRLPDGEPCLKVVFPLPHGSATVVMRASTGPGGSLVLESDGRNGGDAGFYFLVEDRRGTVWKHHLRSFAERITVYGDTDGQLRADHVMRLWGRTVYTLHYKLRRRAASAARERARVAAG